MGKTISLILTLVFLLPVIIFAQEEKPVKVEGSKIDKLVVDTSGKYFLTGYEYSIVTALEDGNKLLPGLEIVPPNQEQSYLNLVPSPPPSTTVIVTPGPPKGVNITINNQYGLNNNAAVTQR